MNINFNALLLIKPLWDWEKSIKQQKNNKNFLNNLDSCIFLFRPSTIDCFKSRGVWLSKKKKLIEEMSRVMYPSDDSRVTLSIELCISFSIQSISFSLFLAELRSYKVDDSKYRFVLMHNATFPFYSVRLYENYFTKCSAAHCLSAS